MKISLTFEYNEQYRQTREDPNMPEEELVALAKEDFVFTLGDMPDSVVMELLEVSYE